MAKEERSLSNSRFIASALLLLCCVWCWSIILWRLVVPSTISSPHSAPWQLCKSSSLHHHRASRAAPGLVHCIVLRSVRTVHHPLSLPVPAASSVGSEWEILCEMLKLLDTILVPNDINVHFNIHSFPSTSIAPPSEEEQEELQKYSSFFCGRTFLHPIFLLLLSGDPFIVFLRGVTATAPPPHHLPRWIYPRRTDR